MVELRPASLLVEMGPGGEVFTEQMASIEHRYIDVISRSDDRTWENNPQSIVFELRRPTVDDLARLSCVVGRIRPDRIEYMHSCGGNCVVYWMQWDDECKENENENPD